MDIAKYALGLFILCLEGTNESILKIQYAVITIQTEVTDL